jgi:flavodoxin
MKIGIIIYSQTGNTKSVAVRIKNELVIKGHSAEIVQLLLDGEYKPGDRNIKLKSIPELSCYDALIFGSPVNAFSLSPAMTEYLKKMNYPGNKKTSCFVTQHFPYAWMGGNRALGTMKSLLEKKNCIVSEIGVINWSNKKREIMTDEVVKKITLSIL